MGRAVAVTVVAVTAVEAMAVAVMMAVPTVEVMAAALAAKKEAAERPQEAHSPSLSSQRKHLSPQAPGQLTSWTVAG